MSDHVDGPRSIGEPAADVTDLFAFTSPENPAHTVLALCVFPSAVEDAIFSNVIDHSIVVRRVGVAGVGNAAKFQPANDEIRFKFRFEVLKRDAAGKAVQSGGCTLPGGRVFLDLGAGRVLSVNPDGSDLRVLLIEEGRKFPDGLAVDADAGYMYWTNMGNPKANDGSILRSDLNGKNMKTIVPPGGTFTPKQLQVDTRNRRLYWSDREGMRVMRANVDGSNIETLVDTSRGDQRPGPDATKWCVGVAVDAPGGKLYWSQKGDDNAGQGRICRADLELRPGETPATRSDIDVLYDGLPEPIDLDLDLNRRFLYWTDRGDPPRGNTVNRAPLDAPAGKRPAPQILFTHLMEGIGLSLDVTGGRMFFTDFGGSVYGANLDGSNPKTLLGAEGNLTGIAYVELPDGAVSGTQQSFRQDTQISVQATGGSSD